MARLHPLSALVDVLQGAVQFGSFAFFLGVMLSGPLGLVDVPSVFVLAPGGALLGAGYAAARYLRFDYELGAERLVVTSGVVARQEREIPLRRIQNVDVSSTVVQRVLGLATVRFETAGGGATEAELDAVDADEAERLRHEVGERVRAVRDHAGRAEGEGAAGGRRGAGTDPTEPGQSAGADGTAGAESDEPALDADARTRAETLYEISSDDLLVLSAVSFRPGAIAAPVFGAPFFGDVVTEGGILLFRLFGGGREGGATDPVAALLTAAVGVAAFVVASWVASAALTFVRYYDFRLERVADELRYERGLLGRYSGTVPLEKVQTVTLGENAAMRRLGYASLSVETAGYAPGSDRSGGAETTVPLAATEHAVELARDVQPFGEPPFERPPTRARRRYAIRYVLVSVVLAAAVFAVSRVWEPLPALAAVVPLVGLGVAPVAARAKWRNRGYDERERVVVTRSGFWHRSTRVVPYYRLQTVFVTRTPFQRRWGLASVTADTAATSSLVGGDATAYDVDGAAADGLRERLLDRLAEDLSERRGRRRGEPGRSGSTRNSVDGGESERRSDTGDADGSNP